jgi:hypothetical protein
MIFLALFGLIIIVVMGLNFYDDYHISQIQKYYQDNQCEVISHFHGKYQAICGNNIIIYKNSFSLDIKNPEAKIEIKDITNIKDEIKKPTANTNAKNNLYIKTKNDQIKLEFDNEKKLKEFKGVITK